MDEIFAVAIIELIRLTLLALFLERALALLFESRLWRALDGRGLSPFVAVVVATFICTTWHIDVISAVAAVGRNVPAFIVPYRTIGAILTAMIVAGGSKIAIAIWRIVVNIRHEAGGAR